MLSYRHAFHAGNPADVLKHLVLVNSIEYMLQKPAPILYIDTHAGAGHYQLDGKMASQTQEYLQGVAALDFARLPATISHYQQMVEPFLRKKQYPGSPLIAASLLREQDRLHLFELHGNDCLKLDKSFRKDRRVKVEQSDGYQSLKSLLPPPPPQKRALVMIDPSYEIKDDYEQVVNGMKQAYRRMAHAQFLIWYPVVNRNVVEKMLRGLKKAGLRDLWRYELGLRPDTDGYGMTASGMLVVNPPWVLAEQMRELLPALQQQLAPQEGFVTIEQVLAE